MIYSSIGFPDPASPKRITPTSPEKIPRHLVALFEGEVGLGLFVPQKNDTFHVFSPPKWMGFYRPKWGLNFTSPPEIWLKQLFFCFPGNRNEETNQPKQGCKYIYTRPDWGYQHINQQIVICEVAADNTQKKGLQ